MKPSAGELWRIAIGWSYKGTINKKTGERSNTSVEITDYENVLVIESLHPKTGLARVFGKNVGLRLYSLNHFLEKIQ